MSPFELIHYDFWTSSITIVSGIKYYFIFSDNFSHYLWVYPLCVTSDVYSKFVHFRAFVQNYFYTNIKTFQSNNGVSIAITKFNNFVIKIVFICVFHVLAPHTSQQNVKYERMLQTINNVVCTLLLHARLPPDYWVEALQMVERVLNTLPSTTIKNVTLFHKTPTYDHLLVFGCLCFPDIVPSHKLSPRSTPCIFLGFPTNHKGYLNLQTTQIIISRHIVFEETVFPFGSMTPNHTPSYLFLEHVILPSSGSLTPISNGDPPLTEDPSLADNSSPTNDSPQTENPPIHKSSFAISATNTSSIKEDSHTEPSPC